MTKPATTSTTKNGRYCHSNEAKARKSERKSEFIRPQPTAIRVKVKAVLPASLAFLRAKLYLEQCVYIMVG